MEPAIAGENERQFPACCNFPQCTAYPKTPPAFGAGTKCGDVNNAVPSHIGCAPTGGPASGQVLQVKEYCFSGFAAGRIHIQALLFEHVGISESSFFPIEY